MFGGDFPINDIVPFFVMATHDDGHFFSSIACVSFFFYY